MKVAVYTGSRSEYGLLLPVLRALHADPAVELQVLIGGSHTDPRHGLTARQVFADGFDVCMAIAQQNVNGADAQQAQANELFVQGIGVTNALAAQRPDWLLVYGDRAEAMGAAIAAHYQRVPVAHLEAGDTCGACMPDERTRWAITSLAALALTTNEQASRAVRVRCPEAAVELVGLPSLDLLRAGDHDDPGAVADALHLDPRRPVVLVAENPAPGEDSSLTWKAAAAIGAQVLRTTPNADPGNEAIAEGALAPMRPGMYYGLLRALAQHPAGACMAGNSSSAIKEAPFVGLPAVDVGERQRGRLTSPSAYRWAPRDQQAIADAMRRAIRTRPGGGWWTDYGDGCAGARVVRALKGERSTP